MSNFKSEAYSLSVSHQDTVGGLPKSPAIKHSEAMNLVSLGNKREKGMLLQLIFAQHALLTNAVNELCGFENVLDIKNLVASLQAHAANPKHYRQGFFKAEGLMGTTAEGKTLSRHCPKGFCIPIELEFTNDKQDQIGGFADDELSKSIAGLSASDKATLAKALLADGAGDVVGDIDGDDDPDSVGATIRRQGRQQRRGMRQDAKSQGLAQRLSQRAEAKEARQAGIVPYDNGEEFSDQEGRFWRRGVQNKLMPLVNANSTTGGQLSMANATAQTVTGAPTMEVEITRVSIRVEGGATNVEIQETLIASISVTSVKVGSIELIIGSGGCEFPSADASEVNPPFWENIVVTGGNSNFTLGLFNNGATQLFTTTAYCKTVTRMD